VETARFVVSGREGDGEGAGPTGAHERWKREESRRAGGSRDGTGQ
jgi:hypothetical protein